MECYDNPKLCRIIEFGWVLNFSYKTRRTETIENRLRLLVYMNKKCSYIITELQGLFEQSTANNHSLEFIHQSKNADYLGQRFSFPL